MKSTPDASSARVGAWASVVVAVTLAGGALAAAQRHAAPSQAEARAAAEAPAPQSDEALHRFQHRVLHYLLLPLIDDAEPARWTLQNLQWICDGHGQPSVGGQPIVEGEALPAGPFVLRWKLDRCAAMSDATLIVDGVVELAVFRNGDKLDAKVVGRSLHTVTASGERHWSGRFAGVAPVTVSGPDSR